MMNARNFAAALAATLLVLGSSIANAHDTWVQTNSPVVRVGEAVYVDLMLGNHGNEHRDFKLASKIDLSKCTLSVFSPDGQSHDLKDETVDTGYAPKEGYWSARFVPGTSGLHTVVHTLDTLHKSTRAIKSGKTFFVASGSLDSLPAENPGFDQPLGHALELVPEASTVTPMRPGQPIALRVLFQGKPLADARVTFIPRGVALEEGFDERYERKSDAEGRVTFTPDDGNYYLAVVHHAEPGEKGEGYDRTAYSATLTVLVPETCNGCK